MSPFPLMIRRSFLGSFFISACASDASAVSGLLSLSLFEFASLLDLDFSSAKKHLNKL